MMAQLSVESESNLWKCFSPALSKSKGLSEQCKGFQLRVDDIAINAFILAVGAGTARSLGEEPSRLGSCIIPVFSSAHPTSPDQTSR